MFLLQSVDICSSFKSCLETRFAFTNDIMRLGGGNSNCQVKESYLQFKIGLHGMGKLLRWVVALVHQSQRILSHLLRTSTALFVSLLPLFVCCMSYVHCSFRRVACGDGLCETPKNSIAPITIGPHGFTMVFSLPTSAHDGFQLFYWCLTIGQMMEW